MQTNSRIGEVWVYKTSLTSPLFNEVSVPRRESEELCIFVRWVSILTVSMICFCIGWWNYSDSVFFLRGFFITFVINELQCMLHANVM